MARAIMRPRQRKPSSSDRFLSRFRAAIHLMFDLVQRNKRIIQIVLAVVLLPFAFFGVDSYFRESATGATVAKVSGSEISEQEFQQALRNRQEQLRSMSGGRVDPALLDSPELRFSVLEALIRQRLLIQQGLNSGITVTPDQ